MKHIYRYLSCAVAVLALFGCKVGNETVFGIDTESIASGPDGGTFPMNVSAGNEWVAYTDAPWITISPANGSGPVRCKVQVDSAVADVARAAEIYIQNQETFENKVIKVSQDGYSYSIISDKVTVDIPNYSDYGTRYFDLRVRTNTDFMVNVSEGADWIVVPGDSNVPGSYHFNGNRGVRPRTVNVRVEWYNNTDASTTDARTATLTFTPLTQTGETAGFECETNDVTVTQEAAEQIEAGTRQGDSTALMSISRALNVSSPWDESTNMSTWSNVRLWEDGDDCPEDWIGRVKYARFYMCGTEETDCIPYEVRYLTAAEELVFYSNTNKERMDLSTGPYLSELKDLKRLTIAYFRLTDLDPSFSGLESLEYLNLAGNNFQTVPEEIFEFKNRPGFHALLLNTNYRSLIYDLSNATNLDNLGGLYDETRLKDLFLWENLDTLTLSVNYLRGSLPTFLDESGAVEPGVPVYDEAYFAGHPGAADTLSCLTGMPRILPKAKTFTINNNRFTGKIPQWLLYHPGLDWMDPFTLIFHQEGSLPREEDGNVVDAGFSNTPVDFDYEGVEGAEFGGYYDFFRNKKLSPNK